MKIPEGVGKGMFKIFISLGFGFLIGYGKLINQKLIQINSKLQNVWLVLLIFVMGMSIGANRDILKKLPSLGGKALFFAVICIVGSVLMVYFLSRLFLEREDGKE